MAWSEGVHHRPLLSFFLSFFSFHLDFVYSLPSFTPWLYWRVWISLSRVATTVAMATGRHDEALAAPRRARYLHVINCLTVCSSSSSSYSSISVPLLNEWNERTNNKTNAMNGATDRDESHREPLEARHAHFKRPTNKREQNRQLSLSLSLSLYLSPWGKKIEKKIVFFSSFRFHQTSLTQEEEEGAASHLHKLRCGRWVICIVFVLETVTRSLTSRRPSLCTVCVCVCVCVF